MAAFDEADASPSTGEAIGGDVKLPSFDMVSAAPQTGASGSSSAAKVHRDAQPGGYARRRSSG